MGTTAAMIVLSGPPAAGDAAVAAWLAATGWEETAVATAICTTFALAPEALGVTGEPLPSGDPRRLRQATEELSRRTGGLAVGIGIEDSDILVLAVAEAGSLHSSVELGPIAAVPAPAPDPIWDHLLAPGFSREDLAAVWAAPATYAEEVLAGTARLCGWATEPLLPGAPTGRSVVKQRSLRRIDPDARPDAHPAGPGEGARLGHVGGDEAVRAAAGADLRLQVVAHGIGEPGTRLTVIVWGPALDEGLIRLRGVELLIGHPAAPQARLSAPFGDAPPPAAVHFEVALPRGVADQAAALRGVSAQEGVRRWLETRIEATVIATALRSGVATLHTGLIPDAIHDRAVTWSLDVDVS